MSVYEEGTFRGTVTDYGLSETKGGGQQVFVAFDVEFPQGKTPMTWFGSLKEGKAREITLTALLNLGHKGKVSDLLDGPNQDNPPILIGTDANLVCANNEYEGKTSVRINWVNRPGGTMKIQRSDSTTAKAALAKMNVDGDLAKLRATTPAREVSLF